MADRKAYTRLQITLHWLIAILIVAAWLTSDGMGDALEQRIEMGWTGMTGNQPHNYIGGIVFALILIRIVVRLRVGAPAHLPETSPMMAKAADWGHKLLYALMLIVPALGAASWYGANEALGDPHEMAANALLAVAFGHALVALYHHYVVKDQTLLRMTRPSKPK